MKLNLERRAAMKALLGSPIAAKGIIEAAAFKALGYDPGNLPSGNYEIASGANAPSRDPLDELFHRHSQKQRIYLQLRRAKNADHVMSESIRSKKSWSGAFKNHLAREELRQEMIWEDYSEGGKIRALVNIGVLPRSLLE